MPQSPAGPPSKSSTSDRSIPWVIFSKLARSIFLPEKTVVEIPATSISKIRVENQNRRILKNRGITGLLSAPILSRDGDLEKCHYPSRAFRNNLHFPTLLSSQAKNHGRTVICSPAVARIELSRFRIWRPTSKALT